MVRRYGLAEGHQTSELRCPNCGRVNDAASAVVEPLASGKDIKPKPGDLSICIECGHFCIFNEELKLRDLTEEEKRQWAGDPKLVSVSEALVELKKRN